MGHRLSKIYTRTGDEGTTGLGDGRRVAKSCERIHALGDIDELNSLVGVLQLENLPADIHELLTDIQHDLFDLGGELSVPGMALIRAERVLQLEQILDQLNVDLAPLKEFILPGGSRAAAVTHLVRAVCRRAERVVVVLNAVEPVRDEVLQYLNRLSDLLFVLARHLNRVNGEIDVLWQKGRTTKV